MRQKLTVYFVLLQVLFTFNAIGADDKPLPQDQAVPFTLADRDRITRMEVKIDDMDKRFEGVNSRFEELDKRIDQTNMYIGWMILVFAGIAASTIGFAIWDRRTMIRPFETKVKEIETNLDLKGTRVEKILTSLRELAKTDSKLAEILKNNQLL